MENENTIFDNGAEITSVGSFIEYIKELRKKAEGDSTEFYFRGQEVEFWDIEPSVFRDNMLSVEHKLMQIPLQKNPFDFKELNDTFDIMTKYQHYGMCTRLLDLTTNPLVALYFACKLHGKIYYDSEGVKEPTGIVYYAKYYPYRADDMCVKIVTSLTKYDLSKENTISDILTKLVDENIITSSDKDKWLKEKNIKEFIDMIQQNYLVVPTYSNERLKKQSGVLLLVSSFTVEIADSIASGVITKSKKNLRSEFDEMFFYIPGENKKEIIKELDLFGINEATLFPELEHQLSYIKSIHLDQTKYVSDFHRYEGYNKSDISYDNVDEDKLNQEFLTKIDDLLTSKVNTNDKIHMLKIIKDNLVVDWYKRESIISKIKRSLMTYCKSNLHTVDEFAINTLIDGIMMILDELLNKYMLTKDGD